MERSGSDTAQHRPLQTIYTPLTEIESIYSNAVNQWKGLGALEKCFHWYHMPSSWLESGVWSMSETQRIQRAKEVSGNAGASAHLRGILVKEQRLARVGLADYLLELFLSKNIERLSAVYGGTSFSLEWKNLSATMENSVIVGETGPATFTRAYARQTLLELAGSRRHRYAFIDRDDWFIRSRSDIPASSFPDELTDLALLQECSFPPGKAVLVYRGKRPTVEDVTRELSELSGLIEGPTSDRNTLLAQEAEKLYRATTADTFNRDFMAHHFGGQANSKTFNKVWLQFLSSRIPQVNL